MRAGPGARARAAKMAVAAVAAALASGLGTGAASGAPSPPSRVVVVARPGDVDPATGEALARVSGELVAAGFDVQVVPVPFDADPRGTVETVGRELGPAAAFAIFPGAPAADGTPTAEIWVSDRLTGRATVERLSVDPRDAERGAAVLAVRAVELLKASVAELWVPEPARAPPRGLELPASAAGAAGPSSVSASVTTSGAAAPNRPVFSGLGVEAALAVIDHVGGFPADVGPVLRISLGLGRGLSARVSAFGFDRGWELSSISGTASVRQQLATADLVLTFRDGRRLQPLLSASAGASRLGVAGTGNANTPWLGRETATWDAVGGAGGGLALPLGRHAILMAELQALFFWHRPVVRVGDTDAGQVGLPALTATAGLVMSF